MGASSPPEETLKTTTSACTMNDYFAAKMASLRKAKEAAVNAAEENQSEVNLNNVNKQLECVEENLENKHKSHKKKKKKKLPVTTEDIKESNEECISQACSELTEISEETTDSSNEQLK